MSVGLKLRLLLSVSSTYKAHSLALYCLPLLYPQITLTYSFLPKSSYFSTESTKFGAFKKIRKKKIFKLLVEILKAFPVQIYRIRIQTNCSIFLESKSSVHSSPLQFW